MTRHTVTSHQLAEGSATTSGGYAPGRTAGSGVGYVVGVDLGGTKIRAGIADSAGTLLAEVTVETDPEGGTRIVGQIAGVVADLCRTTGIAMADILATGIGGAGVPNLAEGGFDQAPNLGAVDSFSLRRETSLALGHPVVIENDVNVAALGELHRGLGVGRDSFAFISIGTGIGMGLVLHGQLVRGARGAAGEIGLLPFGTDPLDPANHRRGPLEEAVSGGAIAARYGSGLGAKEVFERAASGEVRAIAVLDETAGWVSRSIVAVDAVVNPEVFVLGGGIGSRPELLPLVRRWLARLGKPDLDVRISALGELAPVVGAIRLAIDAAGLSQGGTDA